jgi:dihydroorotate dehydrogenase
VAIKPWLWLPAQASHDLAPLALELGALFTAPVGAEERRVQSRTWTRKGHTVHFENPLGIAGGVDKDGRQVEGWRHFGAGFVEIGTITPRPQAPNPGKIMARVTAEEALWNRMGFPSPGALKTRSYLREFRVIEAGRLDAQVGSSSNFRFPIFANIGKQRETTLEKAVHDYLELIEIFTAKSTHVANEALVDGFVINISSPNTKGLRDLFQPERLEAFLKPLSEKLIQCGRPGLLKLSPDMDEETRLAALSAVSQLDLDGVVVTNTTASRPKGISVPVEGGLSGRPLQALARDFLLKTVREFDRDSKRSLSSPDPRLIVSAGGVLDGHEAKWRLAHGADLVETYSGLVFSGPSFFRKSLKNLA